MPSALLERSKRQIERAGRANVWLSATLPNGGEGIGAGAGERWNETLKGGTRWRTHREGGTGALLEKEQKEDMEADGANVACDVTSPGGRGGPVLEPERD